MIFNETIAMPDGLYAAENWVFTFSDKKVDFRQWRCVTGCLEKRQDQK